MPIDPACLGITAPDGRRFDASLVLPKTLIPAGVISPICRPSIRWSTARTSSLDAAPSLCRSAIDAAPPLGGTAFDTTAFYAPALDAASLMAVLLSHGA